MPKVEIKLGPGRLKGGLDGGESGEMEEESGDVELAEAMAAFREALDSGDDDEAAAALRAFVALCS